MNLIGQKFNMLTVISRDISRKKKRYWFCKCDCGNMHKFSLRTSQLIHNIKKDCGCIGLVENRKKHTKHGKKYSRVYNVWQSMKYRCKNPRSKHYKSYGGRGISYCPEWEDFNNFYKDMGDPPPKLTLDRIDNNKGYFKENCRWTDMKTQNNNRRGDKTIFFRGKERNILDLFKEYMIPLGFKSPSCLYRRLERNIPIEIAISHVGRLVPKKYKPKSKKRLCYAK